MHSHDHEHHSHSHGHSHTEHAPHSFNMAFAIAVSLNLIFVLIETIYAIKASSMSLLADAAHNFGDVLGLSLAWGANWLLTLPARKRYSYGYKRTSILAAVSNALILFASSALIAYEALYKLFHLSQVNEHIVVVLALLGIAINGGTALLFMKGAEEDLNIKGAFLHLLSDALIAFGVVLAALLILYTKQYWIDPLFALAIVGFILYSTWNLLRNSFSLILDAVPHYIDQNGVQTYLSGLPGVTTVHDLHIWGLSTKEVALTAHLVMQSGHLADVDYHQINSVLRNQFRIHHVTLQVEIEGSEFLCLRKEIC